MLVMEILWFECSNLFDRIYPGSLSSTWYCCIMYTRILVHNENACVCVQNQGYIFNIHDHYSFLAYVLHSVVRNCAGTGEVS